MKVLFHKKWFGPSQKYSRRGDTIYTLSGTRYRGGHVYEISEDNQALVDEISNLPEGTCTILEDDNTPLGAPAPPPRVEKTLAEVDTARQAHEAQQAHIKQKDARVDGRSTSEAPRPGERPAGGRKPGAKNKVSGGTNGGKKTPAELREEVLGGV